MTISHNADGSSLDDRAGGTNGVNVESPPAGISGTNAGCSAEIRLGLARRHRAYAFETTVWVCAAGTGIFLAMFFGRVSSGVGRIVGAGIFAALAASKIMYAHAAGRVCRALREVSEHRKLRDRETVRVLARPLAVAAVAFDVAAAPLSCVPGAAAAWASAVWLAAAAVGLVAAPVAWRRLCRRKLVDPATVAAVHWYDGARVELASLVAVGAVMCGRLLDRTLLDRELLVRAEL